MLPDDRLRDLLEQAEDRARPEPEFMDGLFDHLLTRRRRRRLLPFSGWAIPRPVAYAALAPLVVVVAVVGILAVTSPGVPSTGVGGVSPSPSATASTAATASPEETGEALAIPLDEAESATLTYRAPTGWDTFDADSPELPDIYQALRQVKDEYLGASYTASAMSSMADEIEDGDEGAVAIDAASNGVDGALVIGVVDVTESEMATARGEAGGFLSALYKDELENMTGPTTTVVPLGDAISVSGNLPTGHVLHTGHVFGAGTIYNVLFLTKENELDQQAGARVFEVILNSIGPGPGQPRFVN
jgi:hypothetical protein